LVDVFNNNQEKAFMNYVQKIFVIVTLLFLPNITTLKCWSSCRQPLHTRQPLTKNTKKHQVPKRLASKAIHRSPQPQKSKMKKVMYITLPKSGTHLLLKCIALFGDPQLKTKYEGEGRIKPSENLWKMYDQVNQFDPPNHFRGRLDPLTNGALPDLMKRMLLGVSWTHWPYTQEAEDFIAEHAKAGLFIIRDPRAMLVSMAFMVSKGWRAGELADPILIMQDFIDGRQKNFIRWGVTVHESYPLMWEYGVVGFYKMYLPWMQAKKFYTVHFENLVGSQGGGSDAAQYQEIRNIANHIGVSLSDEKIKNIVEELFGGSTTFREGQIDGWKKYFTPEMKEAFKKVPGANQLLIDLGYETNTTW
jgi:hypothetical protein